MMKTSNIYIKILIFCLLATLAACTPDDPFTGFQGNIIPKDKGLLEIDFALPNYPFIQKGLKRVDLALSYSMDSMYKGFFFKRVNVSDAKEFYKFSLYPGSYYYQAIITCMCGGDSCLLGGFPYGYGGLKYTFDKVAPIIDKCVKQNDTLIDIHACLSREIPTESDFVVNGAINLAGEKILEKLRYSTAFEI